MEILVAEDDARMASLLERGLSAEGHRVFVASDGRQALEFAGVRSYDVIVLDVLMPFLSGIEVAKRLRDGNNKTPILMLTARDSPKDAVQGLDAGADDYLTKPFAFDEFLARLRAVSRRGPIAKDVRLSVADLALDPASRDVLRGDRRIDLTRREFQVLELLMRRAGRVVTRDSLIEIVWGGDSDVQSNTVDAFVSALRRKLEVGEEPRLIHTARGVGFSIREPG